MKQFLPIIIILFLIYNCRDIPTINNQKDDAAISAGKIFITSYPSGARIYVNGQSSGKVTPDSLLNLLPGTHQLKLNLENYRDTTVSIITSPGKLQYVSIALKAYLVN